MEAKYLFNKPSKGAIRQIGYLVQIIKTETKGLESEIRCQPLSQDLSKLLLISGKFSAVKMRIDIFSQSIKIYLS